MHLQNTEIPYFWWLNICCSLPGNCLYGFWENVFPTFSRRTKVVYPLIWWWIKISYSREIIILFLHICQVSRFFSQTVPVPEIGEKLKKVFFHTVLRNDSKQKHKNKHSFLCWHALKVSKNSKNIFIFEKPKATFLFYLKKKVNTCASC